MSKYDVKQLTRLGQNPGPDRGPGPGPNFKFQTKIWPNFRDSGKNMLEFWYKF